MNFREGLLKYTFPKSASQGGFAGRTFLGKVVREIKDSDYVMFRLIYIQPDIGGWTKLRSMAEVRLTPASLVDVDLSDVELED